MSLTIDTLYEAFMDEELDFGEDVFAFFGKENLAGLDQEQWGKTYGVYLPTFDPSQINLSARERDLDYRNALNTLRATQEATESVYETELDTLSTSLGREMDKGRELTGGIGLRSGGLERALQDTIDTTGSKAEDFGDRMIITGKETKDKYNTAMVDTALDFEKTERHEKEEFYDRTMAAIMKLMETGAFDESVDPPDWSVTETYYDEDTGEACICETAIDGTTTCDPPTCNPDWQSNDESYCDPQIDDPSHYLYCESDQISDEIPSDVSLGGCTRQEQDCSWLCQQNPFCDCPADICYSGSPDFSVIDCSQC